MGDTLPSSASSDAAATLRPRASLDFATLTPVLLLCAAIAAIAFVEPTALSYDGLSLILIGTMPIVLATLAQLFVMAAGDIDLGLGQFVGLINVLVAADSVSDPGRCLVWLALATIAYLGMGALIIWRRIPSIVVTFGMGSIWLGFALIVMPVPSGEAPSWLTNAVNFSPSYVPLPVLLYVLLGGAAHFLLFRTRLGTRLRAVGASPQSSARMGISVIQSKLFLYGLAALMAVLTGLAMTGISGSGDPNAAATLVLSTVAAVIVGGGEFRGGRVNPVGAICAAVAIGLITSIMALLNISAAYTTAVEGLILVCGLGLRIVGVHLANRDRRVSA